MAKGQNYTIIKNSGRTEYHPDSDYYAILSNIAHEYGSAGGEWDRPNMLLLNGQVVVSKDIADVAWEYGKRNRELHDEIHRKIRDEFRPDWMEASSDG